MAMKVGLAGWRGMVGSVLIQRMLEENDFDNISPIFLSTSLSNTKIELPMHGELKTLVVQDAYDLELLKTLDVILSCQGSEYTSRIYPLLRESGWQGYWIDAASILRLQPESMLVLDPINYQSIINALSSGVKTFVGANCTVSLMLMAAAPLFQEGLVDWAITATYQAVSGAGASALSSLLKQLSETGYQIGALYNGDKNSILAAEDKLTQFMKYSVSSHDSYFSNNLIPWIGAKMPSGQTQEEWKSSVEASRILNKKALIDGVCVRVDSLRCHSQAVTLKLNKDISIDAVKDLIVSSSKWIKWVENNEEAVKKYLSPVSVSGTLSIAIGRVRKLEMGNDFLSFFTIGDQLLWGAAEPLRRMLNIIQQSGRIE